jgi:pimeloyl-ACP methyl ester carboxylesterase
MSTQGLISYRSIGKGQPLLLLHGAMVNGTIFSLTSVAEELSKTYEVIIPDLAGHGASKNIPGPYTVERLANDVVKLLGSLGIRSVYLLGYSYGGAVAQQIAHTRPSLVKKLILASTFAYNKITLREKIEGMVAPLILQLLGVARSARLLTRNLPEFANNPALSAALEKIMADNDTQTAVAVYRALLAFDSRPWAEEIDCPTLIIAGTNDTAVPPHHAYFLHSKIKGSQLEIFKDAGHALLWTDSVKFVNSVKSFLG